MDPAMFNNFMTKPRYTNYEADPSPLNRCKVSLKNKDLWRKFHELETEMIITKSGRRMFPSLHIQVSDLDPDAYYCILLEMMPASHCRYKYSASAGWSPAGTEEAQSPHRISLHPESPAKGDYWMSQPISFGRVKLTNTPNAPAGQIVLSSMHKYQPRIIIVKSNDPRNLMWATNTHAVAFPETQFIAVTAYQNEKITQLKIDNNPFAKGFRENGQAKCKRKRANHTEKGGKEGASKKQRTSSENYSSNDDEERISVCSSPSDTPNSLKSTSSCVSPISLKVSDLKEEPTELASPISERSSAPTLNTSMPSPSSSVCSPILTDAKCCPSYSDERVTYPSDRLGYPLERQGNLSLKNNYYSYPFGYNMGYYPTYYSNMFNLPVSPFYNQYNNHYHLEFESPKDMSMLKAEKEVKKFTDFSISTLMAK